MLLRGQEREQIYDFWIWQLDFFDDVDNCNFNYN